MSETIGLLSLLSILPSASLPKVSGSSSPIARTYGTYPAVSSHLTFRAVYKSLGSPGEPAYRSPYQRAHEHLHAPACCSSGRRIAASSPGQGVCSSCRECCATGIGKHCRSGTPNAAGRLSLSSRWNACLDVSGERRLHFRVASPLRRYTVLGVDGTFPSPRPISPPSRDSRLRRQSLRCTTWTMERDRRCKPRNPDAAVPNVLGGQFNSALSITARAPVPTSPKGDQPRARTASASLSEARAVRRGGLLQRTDSALTRNPRRPSESGPRHRESGGLQEARILRGSRLRRTVGEVSVREAMRSASRPKTGRGKAPKVVKAAEHMRFRVSTGVLWGYYWGTQGYYHMRFRVSTFGACPT